MSIYDFGDIASVLQAAKSANNIRNIAPIYEGIAPSQKVLGSIVDAALVAQEFLGSDTDFLWGLDSWDDMQHVVT